MPRKSTKKDDSQPAINVGLVGHVDHGKTTLVNALTGKWTDTHSEEIKRGITIRLGYANSILRYCEKCKKHTSEEKCKTCKKVTKVLRKVSFVDAPGHESLMATMLAGSFIMDGALLLVAANEKCPQPQTREHLMALSIVGIKNIIIIQNKIDLVSEKEALENYKEIKSFIKGTKYEKAPIIPISAQHNVNIDVLIKTIEKVIPTPKRDSKKDPIMLIARSFDINKPGTSPKDYKGGVLGGSLLQGVLKRNEEVEILPGKETEEQNKKIWKPIRTKIINLMTDTTEVKEAAPGGSIAVSTLLDPSHIKSDSLSGSLLGKPGKLPQVWYEFTLETKLLKRVLGSKDKLEVSPLKIGESLMLNINSAATVGIVTKASSKEFSCKLKRPVCAEVGGRVAISRLINSRFRLIGMGTIKK